MARRGFRYSRWDGTQAGIDLDADSLLAELSDDVLYHGDLNAALRRLVREGFTGPDGRRLMGLQEMIERLRRRRREELERHDPDGALDDIHRRLDEIVDTERSAVDRRARDARSRSGDDAVEAEVDASFRHAQLDMLPRDAAGRIRELQSYEFVDPGARQAFEELVDELRSNVLDSTFNRLSEGMRGVSPEQLARTKDMLAELNRMLDQRARGEEPDFDGFMDRYGDFFPGNPASLDELIEQMARSMAAMQQMLASMSPEQRAELMALSDALLDDMDLRWQVEELARNLAEAAPGLGWGEAMPFDGSSPLALGEMPGVLRSLGDLDALEDLLTSATQPGQLAEADLDAARDLLGDDVADSLARLRELARILEEAGLIEQREGRLELTPRGIRAVGRRALEELYRGLVADRAGRHDVTTAGVGRERAHEHKPYEYGDPFDLSVEQTIRNALLRGGTGTPVRLDPRDFEVERTESVSRTSTVLLLDVSMSMPMRDNFLPAKKVAMALHALITGRYPQDYFGLVSFGRVARDVAPQHLPELSWDFEWGTNMAHALLLARRQLARRSGTRQIIMVTDGEPTAHIERGEAVFEYPPSPETVAATLQEVARCTREGIRINVFMLDDSYYLRSFVERMTRMNRGRAFFTTPQNLGGYVLVDFVESRRRTRRAG